MERRFISMAAALCFGLAGSAGAAEHAKIDKAAKDRIEADYKASRDHCKALKDNAKDVCNVEAKGDYRVAKARLEAQADPSPAHQAKLQKERADAAYQLAKERCDDLNGNAKEACRKDAKAAFVNAKGDAKVTKVAGEKGVNSNAALDQRKDAANSKLDAQYAAAKEHCDSLSGQAKDNCVNDAKKKFDKL